MNKEKALKYVLVVNMGVIIAHIISSFIIFKIDKKEIKEKNEEIKRLKKKLTIYDNIYNDSIVICKE